MNYLLDTVVLIRYLADTGEIPKEVKTILDNRDAKHTFFISTISLMEILYLADKHRIEISIEDVTRIIENSVYYQAVDLSTDIIISAKTIPFYELHDRMILATAKYLDVPIISPDIKFKDVNSVKVLWK